MKQRIRSLFLIFLIGLPLNTQPTFASTDKTVQILQEKINTVFSAEIEKSGFNSFQFYSDSDHASYAGGVAIRDQKITMIVGSDQLSKYSDEALRFITCHEIGHILAGPPYKNNSHTSKKYRLSYESQSDYWAGLKCLPLISTSPLLDAQSFFNELSDSLKDIVGDNPFYAHPIPGKTENYIYHSEYASFQCRYNTVDAGLNNQLKPNCWDEASVNAHD